MSTVATTTNGQNKPATIRQHLESENFKQSIAKVLPKHLTAERMARVAVTALTRTPLLAECDQASFFKCLMDLSQWGLEPDGRRAHLIPFRNNQKGIMECQLIIDYKGLVELCYRSGVVSNIHADIVCENDEFEFNLGEVVKHKIDFRRDRGAMYAAYAIVTMKDGTKKCEVLSKQEIDSVRARSKAGKSGPWVSDFNEMSKKTAFRRVSKWIPLSAEIRDVFLADDDTIEGEIVKTSKPKLGLDDLTSMLIEGKQEPQAQVEVSITDLLKTISECKTSSEHQKLCDSVDAIWNDVSKEQRNQLHDALDEALVRVDSEERKEVSN